MASYTYPTTSPSTNGSSYSTMHCAVIWFLRSRLTLWKFRVWAWVVARA